MEEDRLHELVLTEEAGFAQSKMVQWFSLSRLISAWSGHQEDYQWRAIPSQEAAIAWSYGILESLNRLEETAGRFRMQLESMLGVRTDYDAVSARVKAAHSWFAAALEEQVLTPLKKHYKTWSVKPRTKKYLSELGMLEALALQVQKGWQQAEWLAAGLAGGTPLAEILLDVQGTGRGPGPEEPAALPKPKKGDTYSVTLGMHKEGMSVAEIAATRGMTEGTIESHLIRFIATGDVPVTALVPPESVAVIASELERHEEAGRASAAKSALGEAYTYGMIRAVMTHISRMKTEGTAASAAS
jgi:hypothetical protein